MRSTAAPPGLRVSSSGFQFVPVEVTVCGVVAWSNFQRTVVPVVTVTSDGCERRARVIDRLDHRRRLRRRGARSDPDTSSAATAADRLRHQSSPSLVHASFPRRRLPPLDHRARSSALHLSCIFVASVWHSWQALFEMTATDRAYAFTKERVLDSTYAGGDLITEGEVADALGMSRTPVREAFLRLQGEGLLRLYPKRGALVVPVSVAEVDAVMETRMLVERFALDKVMAHGPARRSPTQRDRDRRAGAASRRRRRRRLRGRRSRVPHHVRRRRPATRSSRRSTTRCATVSGG